MKKFVAFLSVFLFGIVSFAQQLSIGGWQTHMPYGQSIEVLNAGDKLINLSQYGVFTLDLKDSSIELITKLDGLSGVLINCGAYDSETKSLIIGYENLNIDIIKGNKIINVNDIFKKSITGLKVLHSINVIDKVAYINCGFATVLYDLEREEIRDTYYLGQNGNPLSIYEVAKLGNKIYASTDSGILEADYLNPNLANYQNWRKHGVADDYPPGNAAYSLTAFNGKLYAYFVNKTMEYDGLSWSVPSLIYQGGVSKYRTGNNNLIIVNTSSIVCYDNNLSPAEIYGAPALEYSVKSATYDNSGQLWIADFNNCLMKYKGINEQPTVKFKPNGPFGVSARRLAIENKKLLVASGSVGDNYSLKFLLNGVYTYQEGTWSNFNYLNNAVLDTFTDITVVVADPKSNKEYYGTFGKGLLEFNNNGFIKNYSYHNSTIGQTIGNPGQYRVSGLAYDSKNQLWVANYWAEKPISVLKTNGQWQSFEFPGVFSEYKYVADITIDRNDQKWVLMPFNNAILVFKENANGSVTYKKLTSGEGFGNLPKEATEVFSITEDLDGKIWVGTNSGVVVFYSPSSILQSGANIDAQPVRVVDGEFVQLLLATETVTTIKVDGANRKWMGTKNGAWLFSPDGTKQIKFFNMENSPLLANKINDIAIDQETGVVYFATDDGISSYRGDATEGKEENASNVKVFPNPVREGYSGSIAIQGLVNNANVKVTDINGVIVFKTIANGGQAIWNGRNFQGEKVSTGVYLVLSTDELGEQTLVKKILFIH